MCRECRRERVVQIVEFKMEAAVDSAPGILIPHKVLITGFLETQLPHKTVNLLCGDLFNDFKLKILRRN